MGKKQTDLKVSVIIPVYNVAFFIKEAIDSVLNQTLADIELILVNDGSTDSSGEICRSYLHVEHRIRYLEQDNQGVSVARNKGLDLAKGEYIFFMDSDDTIDKDFLHISYLKAKEENSDIVVLGDYYCKRFLYVKVLATCAQLIRRAFLEEHNDIRFPKGIQPGEDGLFSHQLFALTENYSLSPESNYFYRQHDNQHHISNTKNAVKIIKQIPQWLDILHDFYTSKGLLKSHALHLAKFLEHEPFEFRYMVLPLDGDQKKYLFDLIHSFYAEYVAAFLTKSEFNQLTRFFKFFLTSKDPQEFERKLRKNTLEKKWLLRLIKLIPITSIRRSTRNKVNNTY